ncbi:MAG: anti-sigma factor family protein [Candidatus Polarisedimenticolia bacterium]
MLTCKEVLAEIDRYLDGEAAAPLRRDLEAHLKDCRPCEVVVDSTRKTVTLVTASRSFELPPGLSAKIMAKVRGRRQGKGGR